MKCFPPWNMQLFRRGQAYFIGACRNEVDLSAITVAEIYPPLEDPAIRGRSEAQLRQMVLGRKSTIQMCPPLDIKLPQGQGDQNGSNLFC